PILGSGRMTPARWGWRAAGLCQERSLTGKAETIAVVVVTFNSARYIPDLVASLGPGLDGLAWHLTVADNASSDDSVAVVRAHAPSARIVETGRNAGYAA